MTQLGELAKLLDSIGARGEDGTAEKSIQPPALGGEVRARGRAGQGRGRREGSPADPGALPTRLCPAPVSPRAPRAAWSKGCPDYVPGSAQARAGPEAPPNTGLPLQGKLGTRPPPLGLLRQGRGCSPRPSRAGQRYGAQLRKGWRGGKGSGTANVQAGGSRAAEMWRKPGR